MDRKINLSREDAKNCSECEHLRNDDGTLRCEYFYGAVIDDDTEEKHCKDSVH